MSQVQEGAERAGERPVQGGPPTNEEEIAALQAQVRDADPELMRWTKFRADTELRGAEMCRSAASALVPVVALLFAGFVAFLRVGDVSHGLAGMRKGLMLAPPILWACAGAGLVAYLLPQEWSSVPADGAGIKREFLRFVDSRKRRLRILGGFVLVGIACALWFIATV